MVTTTGTRASGASVGMTLAQGHALRVTQLDSCGRIQYGDRAFAVSEGFVSVAATAATTQTDAIDQQNARGKSIIKVAQKTSLDGYTLEIVFAEVDPELFEIVTGQEVYRNGDGKAIGFSVDGEVDLDNVAYALEVWAGATGTDACDDEDAEGGWGYFLYPFIQGGILGDHTIENGAITFTITGATTQKGNHWGVGPYDVILDASVASPLPEALGSTKQELVIEVDVAPPTEILGAQPLLDPDWAAITTVTPTIATGSYSAAFAVAPDPTDGGVYYDFGDGTWDFVDAPGDVTHLYPTDPHTYTVRASTNGSFVTHAVVVPGV